MLVVYYKRNQKSKGGIGMQQPINGNLLVRVNTSEYKHVNLTSDKQHQLAPSTGVVLAVAKDLTHIIRKAYKLGAEQWIDGLPQGDEWVGKTIRWEKYAEANASFEMMDPADGVTKIKVALVEYKDVASYEG